MNTAQNSGQRPNQDNQLKNVKILGVLCHLAALFSATIVAIGYPIFLLLTSNDELVQDNARESINFQLNMYIWGVIGSLLLFFGVGFFILAGVLFASVLMPIFAMVSVGRNPGQTYRYPFMFRLLN